MNRLPPHICALLALAMILTGAAISQADPPDSWADATPAKVQDESTTLRAATNAAAKPKTAETIGAKPKHPPFSVLLKDAKPVEGLIKLHRKGSKLYGEIPGKLLDTDLIVLISIARGIGESLLLGGMSWSFGDDWIWQFRKVDDRIQIVRRNVRFRAAKGSPQEKAVHLAFTDSVLFSLPIATKSPSGVDVVDLTPVFMSDLPQISQFLRGFAFSRDKSSWASVKGFKDNMEIQVAATYASGGTRSFDTVADSRGVSLYVHYSISRLPKTGYKPRMADDRVGYFLTVVKDYSKATGYDRFVRYVNRWDLRKADPKAKVSPPKRPIIFWLEKTVPFKYRKPIREGILEWNKAFEKAGFVNAVEVRQQPDDATWDPEDINYNTFRWITASAGFAMGPSRVNPTSGQILDADIIFDADFLMYWKQKYEVVTPDSVARSTGGPLDLESYRSQLSGPSPHMHDNRSQLCECARATGRQFALAATMLEAADPSGSKEEVRRKVEKIISQGLKEVVMHEVGHTLGMRHNFKASTYLTLEEISDPEKTKTTGLAASVMDYLPVNFAAKGRPQGDYFSTTIGPYDNWAIEYGYKPISGNQQVELRKIASRCAEPALNYATDEDTRGIDPDPLSNRFDLGKDPINFARQRVELIDQAWPGVVRRMTPEGDAYYGARRAFNILLSEYGRAMHFAARFIGGTYVHRDHRGDPHARPPFAVVDHERQREALTLLQERVLGEDSYEFPPELYNYLAASNWSHWGTEIQFRVDYPIHQVMLAWQDRVLAQLLSSLTLSRLLDSELKVPADQDAFTAAELIERLTATVFSETEDLREGEYTNRRPAISSLRRSLQRRYLERLSDLAMGNTMAPEDCQSVAYAELESLEARVRQVLAGKAQLDTYTRAHLSETATRIRKVLDARLQLRSI